MAKRFERALEAATEQTLIEPNWEGILECVDMIRGSEVPVKVAIPLIQKRYHSTNPHIAHHTLLVLEACVKNCGKKFHVEVATKEFMDDLKNMVIGGAVDKVQEKVLELIQCWSSAFRDKPEYKIVVDTHNLLKMNGFQFPALREADAMFMADSAPDWVEGDNCYRCRAEFGMFTRKHHCRACGQIFCDKCSNRQMLLPQFGIEKRVRVCESCFDKRTNLKVSSSTESKPGHSVPNEERERARLQELMDREAEELQLALAISQSEAEAKERQSRGVYSSVYSHINGRNTPEAVGSDNAQENKEIYCGAVSNIEQSVATKGENEDPPMDSVLAKYLDRDYWERKRVGKEPESSVIPRATAPPPSEYSMSIASADQQNASYFDATLRVDSSVNGMNSVVSSFDKLQLNGKQSATIANGEQDVMETAQFCKNLKEQVDTMDNRMRSNLLRGRSIINDSAIHSLFAQLTNSHADVLARMTKLEGEREYYEMLQDHLAHIQEARQAVNALRDEHRRQKEARLFEEQQQRRAQMQHTLGVMRQKKHEMLLYERHLALQRFQEQEQQMQQRRFMYQQHAQMSQHSAQGMPLPHQQPGMALQQPVIPSSQQQSSGMAPCQQSGMPPQQTGMPPQSMGAGSYYSQHQGMPLDGSSLTVMPTQQPQDPMNQRQALLAHYSEQDMQGMYHHQQVMQAQQTMNHVAGGVYHPGSGMGSLPATVMMPHQPPYYPPGAPHHQYHVQQPPPQQIPPQPEQLQVATPASSQQQANHVPEDLLISFD